MARFDVKTYTRDEWNAVASQAAEYNLLQTWEYGEAKAHAGPWRVERGLIIDGDTELAACQALIRPLAVIGGGLVWINRAPLWIGRGPGPAPQDMEKVLQALRNHYVRDGRWYLRLALPVSGEAFGQTALEAAGYSTTNTLGWASSVLDLRDDEAALRQGLHGKWRSSLNKAERQGLSITHDETGEAFNTFLREHRRMIVENGPNYGIDPSLIEALQARRPDGAKMTAIAAADDGGVLGSVLIASYGQTCEYLAGNTSDTGRQKCAGQMLLWTAVRLMKERGFHRFDLGGMDPERTPDGIFKFKDRMGGAPYRLAPEIQAGGRGIIGSCVRWRTARARAAA